ncbi:hypothetical protein M422DRAFT_254870 [Sphaerobolus stellatus SS14]|uniref:Uncharacterized protein n=1 Tax=Sphaerobolus stellatus (strain SS14) TaxID=990650 RepID=A0A0C9UGI4_SPHS4|nr:hypothetical protein M422DRAFT_254870 [Sphaerobolus stellatus SS14]
MLRIDNGLAVPSQIWGRARVLEMVHDASAILDPFAIRCRRHLRIFASHADFRAATRNVLLFQPGAANATAKYSPPPPSQPRIFVPAVPVVGCQVYNCHAIYESIPDGMKVEVEAIGPLWVEVLTSLQQIRWWRAVDLREVGIDVRLVISLVETDATTSV